MVTIVFTLQCTDLGIDLLLQEGLPNAMDTDIIRRLVRQGPDMPQAAAIQYNL